MCSVLRILQYNTAVAVVYCPESCYCYCDCYCDGVCMCMVDVVRNFDLSATGQDGAQQMEGACASGYVLLCCRFVR